MKKIKLAKLCEMLAARRGAQTVTITTKTVPDMPKTGNPFYGRTEKIARTNGIINWQYETAVNRQRVREGLDADFEAEPRKWGVRVPTLPFVLYEKNETLYLELKVEKSLDHHYLVDGQPHEAKPIELWLRPKSPGRQGVEKEVMLRDYRLDHIHGIAVAGEVYEITHHDLSHVMQLAVGLIKNVDVVGQYQPQSHR